jgi:predicted dehydrogenase
VVDCATHPAERAALIRDALNAGRHVLSQKRFVLDLATGRHLVELAERRKVRLAVNQNGRWSPHFSYLTQLVRAGRLGDILSIDFQVAWDHSWVRNTVFNTMHHLVLYDFAVHWFDIATVLLGGRRARRVFGMVTASPAQRFDPPALASALAEYGDAQVRWSFTADNRYDQTDRTLIVGTLGTALSQGPGLSNQQVTVTTKAGTARAELDGTWFDNGFRGTMGELLCAIAEDREPSNSARQNLATLELAFAALASAETGRPQVPGRVTRLSRELLDRCRPRP